MAGWQPSGTEHPGPSPLPPVGQAPTVPSGAADTGAKLDIAAINDLVKRLRHAFAVEAAPEIVSQVPFVAGRAVRICAANPKRIQLSIQVPAGVLAYEGPDQSVSVTSGYALPVGGGYEHGPEATRERWFVSASSGTFTVKELIGDVGYP